jgi:hypothetical protein
MERDNAARERGASAAIATRALPNDLVDRRSPIVAFRSLNIDRRMQ